MQIRHLWPSVVIESGYKFFSVDDFMANDTQVVYENYTSIVTDQLSEGAWIEVSTLLMQDCYL